MMNISCLEAYNPFSNWRSCLVRYKGHTFRSVEQAYQYAKAVHVNDTSSALKLRYTTDPRRAKDIGSKVTGLGDSNWDIVKFDVMKELVEIKFTNNRDLQEELLKTGNKILAESGFDQLYAIGLPITHKDIFNKEKWSGKNKLGQILCKVRSIILNK